MKQILLVMAVISLSASAFAGPKPAGDFKKSFYTTPIKEFKGAAFYQWKKYEVKSVVTEVNTTKEVSKDEPAPRTIVSSSVSAKKD